MSEESMRLRDHGEEELSHYSNATTDIEFKFPFGWGELWGVASRTDFDLNVTWNTQTKTLTISIHKRMSVTYHTASSHL